MKASPCALFLQHALLQQDAVATRTHHNEFLALLNLIHCLIALIGDNVGSCVMDSYPPCIECEACCVHGFHGNGSVSFLFVVGTHVHSGCSLDTVGQSMRSYFLNATEKKLVCSPIPFARANESTHFFMEARDNGSRFRLGLCSDPHCTT